MWKCIVDFYHLAYVQPSLITVSTVFEQADDVPDMLLFRVVDPSKTGTPNVQCCDSFSIIFRLISGQ